MFRKGYGIFEVGLDERICGIGFLESLIMLLRLC